MSAFDVSDRLVIPKASVLEVGNETDDLSHKEDDEGERNKPRYHQLNHLKAIVIERAAIVEKKSNRIAATIVGHQILAEEDLSFRIAIL